MVGFLFVGAQKDHVVTAEQHLLCKNNPRAYTQAGLKYPLATKAPCYILPKTDESSKSDIFDLNSLPKYSKYYMCRSSDGSPKYGLFKPQPSHFLSLKFTAPACPFAQSARHRFLLSVGIFPSTGSPKIGSSLRTSSCWRSPPPRAPSRSQCTTASSIC